MKSLCFICGKEFNDNEELALPRLCCYKCENCEFASFKRFGCYCEIVGKPITNDKDKKKLCKRVIKNEVFLRKKGSL